MESYARTGEDKSRHVYSAEKAHALDERLQSIDAYDMVTLLCNDKGYISPFETIYPDPKRPKYVRNFNL